MSDIIISRLLSNQRLQLCLAIGGQAPLAIKSPKSTLSPKMPTVSWYFKGWCWSRQVLSLPKVSYSEGNLPMRSMVCYLAALLHDFMRFKLLGSWMVSYLLLNPNMSVLTPRCSGYLLNRIVGHLPAPLYEYPEWKFHTFDSLKLFMHYFATNYPAIRSLGLIF
jgi:hypothetical protein